MNNLYEYTYANLTSISERIDLRIGLEINEDRTYISPSIRTSFSTEKYSAVY
jgi:hypothetical protein